MMVSQEMGQPAPRIDILGNRKLTFAFRIMLGLTLLIFGASKVPELAGFADTVMGYRVLPDSLARAYGFILPGAEIIVGICLITGLRSKIAAFATILIIASLIAGTTASLYLVHSGVRTCGCLGGVDWQLGISHLAVQFVMLTMAAQIWLHKGEFLSLDSRRFPQM